MADEIRNIEIHFDTNASQVNQEVDGLNQAVAQSTTNTTNNTVASHSNTQALKENSKSVLDNGGAMGILNMLTGGYAQIVKDAVEASSLFTKAKKADAVATELQTVATSKASLATTIWNAILAVNPIILIATGVVALTTGLYFLTKAFLDNAEAVREVNKEVDLAILKNDAYKNSVKQLNSDLDSLNAIEIARAKAMGVSSDEIDKMTLKQKALNKELLGSQAKDAYQNLLDGQKLLRKARMTDDEDAIKNAEENLKTRKAIYEEANQAYSKSIDDETLAVLSVQEKAFNAQKSLDKKAISDKQARKEKAKAKKIADEAKEAQRIADLAKLKTETENSALKELQDINDKTEEEKLARQKERDLAEIEALRQKGVDVANLLAYNEEKYNTLEEELRLKRAEEKKVIDEKKLADEQVIAEALIQQQRDLEDARYDVASKGLALVSNVFTKSKGIQKAIMIAEGALSIGKMIAANNLANIGALATPQAIATSGASAIPVIAMNNISTGIGIASTVAATAKALSSLGGGSVSGGSAGATPTAGTQPSVSFVTSSENQISDSINNNADNNRQVPIKAYVVSKEVTTAQELDRNLIASTTI